MGDRGIGTRIAVAVALAFALGTVFAGAASAQGGSPRMQAFSDPAWGTSTSSGPYRAFSDLNYTPATGARTVGMQAFSNPNAFGPVPKVVTVYASTPTHIETQSWAANWRTVALVIIAGLLALSLGLVAIRSRRTQHTLA
jgi:hypothetical protein